MYRSMKIKSMSIAIGLLMANSAFAHHSQAMFDMTKCYTLEGTVRTFQYQFPHSWLWVVVPNTQGGEDVWGFESAAPSQMMEIDPRWKRDIVRKGDKIKINFSPMRDGRTGGAMGPVTLPDGSVIRAATPACSSGKLQPSGAPPVNSSKKGAAKAK